MTVRSYISKLQEAVKGKWVLYQYKFNSGSGNIFPQAILKVPEFKDEADMLTFAREVHDGWVEWEEEHL